MKYTETNLEGLILLELDKFEDDRGYFMELFNSDKMNELFSQEVLFVQDNSSVSKKGVFRGFHFQEPPFAQAKLVQVLSGKVMDIVIDIRKGSKTYGKTFKVELSGNDNLQLFIPKGFAHGFISIEHDTRFHYKCDNYYSKDHERTLSWNDFSKDLDLPFEDLIISDKDMSGRSFSNFVSPF